MNKLLYLFLGLVLLSACGGKKAETSADKDTLDTVIDTLVPTPIDVEDPIIAQTKVPKAADGVFYDFVSSFCQNSAYQKSRIKFPLKCVVAGQSREITANEWHFSKLYYNSDIYTVFMPDAESLALENDTSVTAVTLLWYNMVEGMVSRYNFHKTDGQWMLSSIEENEIVPEDDNGFIGFYYQFASYEEFRKNHLAETIVYDGIDPMADEEFEAEYVKEKKIHAADWSDELIPELPFEQFSNIDFGQDLSGTERVVSVESPSSSFGSRLLFQKDGEEWRLHKIENF